MIRSPKEQVYVVPREELFPEGAPHGFLPGEGPWLRTLYDRGFYKDRDLVEDDPSLKQVIPYAVVAREGRVFLFRRLPQGGEQRLVGKRSIGVGGHVNPEDSGDVVTDALTRELNEELHLGPGWTHRIAGLLNDDTNSVGSVHVGVVVVVDPGPVEPEVREVDMMCGSLVEREDLLELHARERGSFEGWSAHLLDRLPEVLAWAESDGSSGTTRSGTRTFST